MSHTVNWIHIRNPHKNRGHPNFLIPQGWGVALTFTHAHVLGFLYKAGLGQMFSVCSMMKWMWVSDLVFIFYEWERETCSLSGIQNEPASLTNWKSQCQFVLCDSSRILTGECTDKRVPFVGRLLFMWMTNCSKTEWSRMIVNTQTFLEITQKIYWNILNNLPFKTEKTIPTRHLLSI